MEVYVLPRKDGIWLENGVLVDVIERKLDVDYEFTTIVLSEMVWQDNHIAIFGEAGNEQQFIAVTVVCGRSGWCSIHATWVPPLGLIDYSPLPLGAALQLVPERLFHRVSWLRQSCVMSLTLRTELQVELLTAFLNTRGPRAILSSDSYPLDHSPVIIELLFGTLSVPAASLSLRSTSI
ncbi:hypothetical protein HETIRDRAFT_115946 [Heterobasidion irregulare TC 32-1]|uniref:Uncharacterized protein n=1 Tax=Heterobasidion irregulare (strain TC 32-1) TaxID=747525 RepID=W4K630_HETIT|nr:uncharacterized protein HETIRDRAFT_115946 [Heterobasidion irregulare TC 32-1]ETW80780.1 hypothetical protein HETIRDRAFT_115946 [Heterobasidion irregulare TC 32-1]